MSKWILTISLNRYLSFQDGESSVDMEFRSSIQIANEMMKYSRKIERIIGNDALLYWKDIIENMLDRNLDSDAFSRCMNLIYDYCDEYRIWIK